MSTPRHSQISSPTYTAADLQDGWEFKVVTSRDLAFRKPEVLEKVRAEEAQASWVLIEKIDDGHLRFKRLSSAGSKDDTLSIDPYRTRYGTAISIWRLVFWFCVLSCAVLSYLFLTKRL